MVENTCYMCAGKCRGHSLGSSEEWVPEPGSPMALDAEIYDAWEAACTANDRFVNHDGWSIFDAGYRAALATRAAPPAMDREAVEKVAEQLSHEAEDWRHNTYTRVMLKQMRDRLSATLSADAIRQGEGSLRAHVQKMQEACANYLEPATYVARHPDTSKIGDCPWVREFEMPDRYASPEGAAQTNKRRDAAFIRDMIYMLDGPEQRAAMPATPASHASDGGKA